MIPSKKGSIFSIHGGNGIEFTEGLTVRTIKDLSLRVPLRIFEIDLRASVGNNDEVFNSDVDIRRFCAHDSFKEEKC